MTNIKPTTELFANRCGYSDVYPFEIVRIVSEKCIEVRELSASENKTKMNFHVGGFSAHCSNQHAQDYDYTTNPEGRVVKIRLHKDKWWRSVHGERFDISDKPRKFYDYNF